MIFDTHVHSAASPDSEMDPEEAIEIMSKKGMGLIFTEHADYNPKGEVFFSVDFNVYPQDYIKYKSDNVGLGLELNLLAECVSQNQALAANTDLDYIIGSVHWTDGFDIFNAIDYYEEIGEKFYNHYLEYTLKMIKINDFFDSLGHIDYISRYSPLPEANVLYQKYSILYDKILQALIKRDKLLELSTRRFDDKGAIANLTAIFSRYHKLGGRYVTIGSDAHGKGQLGYNFDAALEMIKEIGLAPVYFKERRMVVC